MTIHDAGHLSVAQLVAKARTLHSKEWHWPSLDIETRVRPRTHAENLRAVSEIQILQTVAGEDGTPDYEEIKRAELRAALPCITWPDGTPVFPVDDLDAVMEMDSTTLMEAVEQVNVVSNFTKGDAEEAAKNSVRTDDDSPSSRSPAAAETSAPSLSLAPSTSS